MRNPLLDKDFLIELDHYHEKERWAKIIALDINEVPTEEITGRVTSGGSINVDGTSAVRRSCSLTMVAKDVNINDFYWGLHSKFQLYIGLTNKINPNYPDIIWFPQGVYLISSFNTSQSTNSYNISIQGKDKMCLLNGEIGGTLTMPIDFGKIEERDAEGNLTITDIPIKDIIKEAVHEYAKEPWHNIIVNDLEDLGVELLEYKGSKPLYMLIDENKGEVTNLTINANMPFDTLVSGQLTNGETEKTIGNIDEAYLNKLNEFYPGMKNNYATFRLKPNGELLSLAKIEYGQTAGYRLTDITYPGDLIANQGDSLTSILDKLVQMLGQFEYFYDIDGRFIFQKKKIYTQTTWNNLTTTDEDEVIADTDATPYGYEFKGNDLTISFSNSPNLGALKNDFSIWGTRKSVSGAEIPVHLRYAIDTKPFYYKAMDGKIYSNKETIDKLLADVDNYYDTIKKETIHQIETYQKAPTPMSISSDWWEVLDWANYYKIITGSYPELSLRNYVPVVSFKLSDIPGFENDFPKPNISLGEKNEPGTSAGNYNTITSIFDVYWQESTQRYTLSYCGHGNGCNHLYTYFTDRAETGKGTSYIYQPEIPQATWEKWEEDLNNEKEEIKKNYIDTDWREIIYQMAKDYRKYNHDDDFLARVRDNNIFAGEYLYPTGYTGYEQYYIDLEGFWRQLYNPNYMVDDKKLNLGGDGPIETEIDLNDMGMFPGIPEENVYVYPFKEIDPTEKDEEDKYLYTPEKSYIVVNLKGMCDIKPFIHKDFFDIDESRVYYIKYKDANNKDTYSEIKPENAKTMSLGLIYLSTGENEYERMVDVDFYQGLKKELKNEYLLCVKSEDSVKLIDIKNAGGIISKIYYDETKNIYLPCYFTQREVTGAEDTYYFDQTKIQYYYTTYNYYGDEMPDKKYWNKNVWDSPQSLNFWFDFMDTTGELNKYSVSVVGNRPKVVNDNSIKSIYFRETPNVVFINKNKNDGWEFTERKSGYTYIQLPDSMLSLFRMSGQGKSAWNMLEECMYNDTYCIEAASITTIPIYYLKPNTKMYIRDDNSKIDGEYMVSRFTLPLTYNGTMSISATKMAEKIY